MNPTPPQVAAQMERARDWLRKYINSAHYWAVSFTCTEAACEEKRALDLAAVLAEVATTADDAGYRRGVEEERARASACVPMNWVHPMLTGPGAALNHARSGKWDCRDVEALLRAIQDAIRARTTP